MADKSPPSSQELTDLFTSILKDVQVRAASQRQPNPRIIDVKFQAVIAQYNEYYKALTWEGLRSCPPIVIE